MTDRAQLRHPRRFGFFLFNAIAATLLVGWVNLWMSSSAAGIVGLPNMALMTAALVVLVLVWSGAWIAWGVTVWNRHSRDPQA